jgi:predicted nuclease with TOPRIM domain
LLSNSALKIESVRSLSSVENQISSNTESANNNQMYGNNVLDKNFSDTTATLSRDQNRSGKRIEIISQHRIAPANNQAKTSASLNMLEVEKQLIELRKQTEDLRKQLEMTQQQNEEYRLRLERVEKELESYRDDELTHPG